MKRFAAIGLAAFALSSVSARADHTPRIASLEARLLYETTGSLSRNILPPAQFSGWNTMIGEGDAKEPANDLLVTVDLAIDKNEANIDLPLKVKVTGNGKTLAERTFRSNLFQHGHVHRSVLVPDAACVGRLRVEAVLGAQKKTSDIELNCGE